MISEMLHHCLHTDKTGFHFIQQLRKWTKYTYKGTDSDNDQNGQAVEKHRKCDLQSPVSSPRKKNERDKTAKSKQSLRLNL